MSRYSHGGGDYRHDNGYDRRGGYNNGHRNGGYSYGKINEDDVPESQHSIFIRGLPSSVTFDEIKNFFEDNVGPCSFDFQKVNYERQSLFVAVRFDTKEHAKDAYTKYRDEDILGCRCEVTWFRDIRRYISYQQQTGGVIRRGSFGRGQQGRYQTNPYLNKSYDRKRRYSDDRRSRSRSYSDSDRSRSRSRRSSKSRSSRSHSRSEGERSTSRESDRRRSESKDDKKRDRKKEKKTKKSKKDRRSRRSESASSKSDGERSRSSSRSDRDASHSSKKRSKIDRRDRDGSPASSTGSPLRMTPPPPAPTIIGPIIPTATATSTAPAPVEKPAPLSGDEYYSSRGRFGTKQKNKKSKKDEKEVDIIEAGHMENDHTKIMITIANKTTVPVENTSFKMALDSDEPPRKIVRGPLTPERNDDDGMDIEEKEDDEVPLRKETPTDPKEKGGWKTFGDNSGNPSDVNPETTAPPAPSLVQPTLAKNANGMVPRSVNGPPPSMGTPTGPPPKRPPPGTPSSAPPHGRPSLGGGGVAPVLAQKCPEMAKTIREIKSIQDQLIASVKPNALRLSNDLSGESVLEKMEEREKLINELEASQKLKFDIKMKQIANSYKGDASTITTVIKSVVQKDPSLEEAIKPALLAVLEDLEKQIYKKVDDFLVCGL